MGRGGVLRLLIEVGKVEKADIGKIVIEAGLATVEVVDHAGKLAAKRLDGRILPDTSATIRAWYQTNLDEMPPHFAQLLKWLQLEAEAKYGITNENGDVLNSSVGATSDDTVSTLLLDIL